MPGQRPQGLTHLEGWEIERVPDIRLKAGKPTDADFFGFPRDGFMVWDTTNLVMWIRIAGVWTPMSGGAARVTNSAAQTTVTGVALALAFDTETDNPVGLHSSAANTKFTALTAGRHIIGGNVEWVANAAGVRELTVRVNGTTAIAWRRDFGTAAGVTIQVISTEWFLSAGDYVELVVTQSSGGNLNVNAQPYSPVFWITRA